MAPKKKAGKKAEPLSAEQKAQQEEKEWRETFKLYDRDNDGELSPSAVHVALLTRLHLQAKSALRN
jgi:Ca2+-binding EF-hand superfamily protein